MERLTSNESVLILNLGSTLFLAPLSNVLKSPRARKWAATLIGLGHITTLCGWGSIHLLICLLTCSLIIHLTKRYCFCLCFVFNFTHLAVYHLEDYLGLPVAPIYTYNCFHIIALKMIHLAGEVQDAHKSTNKDNERLDIYRDITFSKIFFFNTSSQATVNFLSYRTYYDFIHHPVDVGLLRRNEMIREVARTGVLAAVTALIFTLYPATYLKADEYYEETFWNRFVYCVFVGMAGRFAMYAAINWVQAMITWSGMGAYPVKTKPRPGKGPTTEFALLKEIENDPKRAEGEEFNFDTIRNMDVMKAEFSPLLRDFWRYYNCSLTYFFIANVYIPFPVVQLKSFAVFLASSWWHGFRAGFFISLCYTALYTPAEDLFNNLYRKHSTGATRVIWNVLFYLGRLLATTYISVTTYLETFQDCWRFTESLYFIPLIIPVVAFCIGLCLKQARGRKED